ncbi:MAG: hypothetical protein ABIE43_05285 [Patescibacteria group bacterium]
MKKLIPIFLFLLFLYPFSSSGEQSLLRVINHKTKQCAEVSGGDECRTCIPTGDWENLINDSCPIDYENFNYGDTSNLDINFNCTRLKKQFCCTENHSGTNGNCSDMIINKSKEQCAFVPDINSFNLQSGWSKKTNDVEWMDWLCPYEWIDDISGIRDKNLYNRLKGKIMLKVEDEGKAYYINPQKETIHYLGKPNDALGVIRSQGVGITNDNLEKLEISLVNLTGIDSDEDGLPDMLEDAIGTEKSKADTDGDGYNDKEEFENGYHPNKMGKLELNSSFADSQKGKIFLQIESRGEAWYVNPADGKRYFLGRPADAFNVMRNLGVGISNNDFDKL